MDRHVGLVTPAHNNKKNLTPKVKIIKSGYVSSKLCVCADVVLILPT